MLQTYRFDTPSHSGFGGRKGVFIAVDGDGKETATLTTPYVFPVINVIGGPAGPDRNGGLWRPVKWWMFLHEPRIPAYLCQVLHVVDFNLQRDRWEEWLSKPFHKWITDWQARTDYTLPNSAKGRPDSGYPFREWMKHWPFWRLPPGTRPIKSPFTFLDSGGFALMKLTNFKKVKALDVTETPEYIFSLQRQQGGDFIASLDRPVPPGLSEDEVRVRQNWSITNALAMLNLVANERKHPLDPDSPYTPFPYVAVHGDTLDTGRWYIEEFFRRWHSDELQPEARQIPFGFAIGSMVPRADDPCKVVEIVWGIMQAIHAHHAAMADAGLPLPPVHVFGINSHLTALLTYLGVDTFDSSTFADVAKRANYLKDDLRPARISEVTYDMLENCKCTVCEGLLRARETDVLSQMTQILGMDDATESSARESREAATPKAKAQYYHDFELPGLGLQKATRSDLYALIAMHNWARLTKETVKIQQHVDHGTLVDHLIEMVTGQDAQRGERLGDALVWLAAAEAKAGRHALLDALPPELHKRATTIDLTVRRAVSTKFKTEWNREMFNWQTANYKGPLPEKKVLLLIACSKGKPYQDSPHQREVLERIRAEFPLDHKKIHKVTFSGLFGPVPEEYEDDTECVVNLYDYKLEEGNEEQAAELHRRLEEYLKQYKYEHKVAYIYFPAYRAVVEALAEKYEIKLLPEHPKRGGKPRSYRNELMAFLETLPLLERVRKGEQLRLRL